MFSLMDVALYTARKQPSIKFSIIVYLRKVMREESSKKKKNRFLFLFSIYCFRFSIFYFLFSIFYFRFSIFYFFFIFFFFLFCAICVRTWSKSVSLYSHTVLFILLIQLVIQFWLLHSFSVVVWLQLHLVLVSIASGFCYRK